MGGARRLAVLGVVAALAVAPAQAQAPTSEPAAPAELRLRVTSSRSEVRTTLYVRDGTTWVPICSTPCAVSPAPGRYRLALSEPDGAPVSIEGGTLELRADGELLVDYRSREPWRIAGGVLLGVGLALAAVLGSYFMWEAAEADSGIGEGFSTAAGASSLALGVGLALAGTVLLAMPDGAAASWRAETLAVLASVTGSW